MQDVGAISLISCTVPKENSYKEKTSAVKPRRLRVVVTAGHGGHSAPTFASSRTPGRGYYMYPSWCPHAVKLRFARCSVARSERPWLSLERWKNQSGTKANKPSSCTRMAKVSACFKIFQQNTSTLGSTIQIHYGSLLPVHMDQRICWTPVGTVPRSQSVIAWVCKGKLTCERETAPQALTRSCGKFNHIFTPTFIATRTEERSCLLSRGGLRLGSLCCWAMPFYFLPPNHETYHGQQREPLESTKRSTWITKLEHKNQREIVWSAMNFSKIH